MLMSKITLVICLLLGCDPAQDARAGRRRAHRLSAAVAARPDGSIRLAWPLPLQPAVLPDPDRRRLRAEQVGQSFVPRLLSVRKRAGPVSADGRQPPGCKVVGRSPCHGRLNAGLGTCFSRLGWNGSE